MRSALHTGITLGVILLLALAFNLVWAVRLPDIRWDLSTDKTNTLSAPVLNLLSTLETPLDFYYFQSSKAASATRELKRYSKHVEEQLKAFETASKGMINLHIINPAPFSEDAYKAGLYGLDDKQGFLGLIGTRDDQAAQRIESFSPDRAALLEYEISHLITRLTRPQLPIVGFLSGLSPEESIESLLQELHQHFDLVQLQKNADHVPASIKTLMLVHPRRLSEQTLYAVDQFVMRGGKLMMFIDPLSEQLPQETQSPSRLEELLVGWGVTMPNDRILIDSSYAASELNPAALSLPRAAMATRDVSTWKLDAVTVSSSGALSRIDKSKMRFTPLLNSSRQSALVEPEALDGDSPSQGSHVIAARIEGPAYSAFPDGAGKQSAGLQKSEQIHVVVVADTDLLSDHLDPSAQTNNTRFVLNTLDNLAAPDELANIRPRAVAGPSLHRLNQLRETAEAAYQTQADDLVQRMAQTEKEWQRLLSPAIPLGTEPVNTNTQLQALNKERLRLPMELHALKTRAYAPVERLERNIKLLLIVPLPVLLGLIAWGLHRWRHRNRPALSPELY